MLIKSINPAVSCEYNNIRKIYIYNDGEILFTSERGELQESIIDKYGKISTVYDGKIRALTLATEPKRARKINLSRKDNFYLTWRGDYSWESGIALYIHVSEIAVENAGEFLAFENNGERCYKTAARLRFNNGAMVHRLKCERVPEAGKDFRPPEGCKWSDGYSPNPEKPFYDVVTPGKWGNNPGESFVVRRWISKESINEILVESSYYTRRETDPERANREIIAAKMTEILRSKSISHYDVERLLEVFNITFKEDEEK
jgi:hypothetical protein